jgi:hypothetical protein
MLLLVHEFLVKEKTIVIPQPLYSQDLTPAGFGLFPRLKSAMKGHQFYRREETEEHLLRDLCSIPQNTFQNWKRTLEEVYREWT